MSCAPQHLRTCSSADYHEIPLCDNLLEIAMPDTPLTEILSDFRSYRPGNHREFLEWVRDRAQDVGVKEFALRERKSAGQHTLPVPSAQGLRFDFSSLFARSKSSPRLPLASLVLHKRVHTEEDVTPNSNRRKPNRSGKDLRRHP